MRAANLETLRDLPDQIHLALEVLDTAMTAIDTASFCLPFSSQGHPSRLTLSPPENGQNSFPLRAFKSVVSVVACQTSKRTLRQESTQFVRALMTTI